MALEITNLPPNRIDEAVDVLADAFFDYPVMRFVIAQSGNAYAGHLRTLVRFFTAARFLQHDLVMAVITPRNEVVAIANVNRPGEHTAAPALGEIREQVWRELGDAARSRYEAYGEVTRTFGVGQPHYHLGMLGVRKSHAGQGLARRLLDALHERSARDPQSHGVTLNTEDPRNVPLYEHFGYRLIAQGRVSEQMQTWAFYRPDAQTG